MDKLKIYRLDIENKKDSEEVQILLISAGFKWNFINEARIEHPFTYPISLYIRPQDHEYFCGFDGDAKLIKLDQLKDMVVLKCNDVKHANSIDKKGEAWYLASDGTYYAWQYRKLCWDTESYACVEAHDIKPITIAQDPALISGAAALADIVNVQHNYEDRDDWYTTQYSTLTIPEILKGETSDGRKINFRLKPLTIKLELDLPKPFVPVLGEKYYYLKAGNSWGFGGGEWGNDSMQEKYIQFGAWRTEEEMKQVVSAWRKAIKELSNA